jgi:hypothetical protein
MRGKKAKQLRQSVKHGYGNVSANYQETNVHPKVYSYNLMTNEPEWAMVNTTVLAEDCGRKAYKMLKKLYKG